MTTAKPDGTAPAAAGARRLHARIVRQTALVRRLVDAGAADGELEARADAVSGWSVAEQLEHVMLVERGVLGAIRRLLDGTPPAPPPAPVAAAPPPPALQPPTPLTWGGRLVLATGYIPRGVAKTPAAQRPTAASAGALAAEMPRVEERLLALGARLGELQGGAGPGGRLPHPRFGDMDARQWLRFLAVHNHHHLKIVRDIRRARALSPIDLPR